MANSLFIDIYQMLCEKYPNRNIYVISDHHFYHNNIINYTRSNFTNVDEMNNYIIDKHNEIIGKDDIVLFLGDFCFKNNTIKEILERLNGHKFLILGNHDRKDLIKNYPSLGFENVFLNPIKIQNNYFSHEPLVKGEREDLHFQLMVNEFLKRSDGINYYGHVHTKEKILPDRYQNVTCEALDYKPLLVGKTRLINQEPKNLFINSPYLEEILLFLRQHHGLDSKIILNDYIYTMILENCLPYQNQFFVQGSFGLLKKYNFISKISDLDIACFSNPSVGKDKNANLLKTITDNAYESLKMVNNLNMCFIKRYSSLRIFETLYTSKQAYLAHGYFDANLIFLDCYKSTDFISLEGKSLIESYLLKSYPSFRDEFQFPHFVSWFLTPEGDLANLILQYIFEKDHENKKILILKKIQYIYNQNFKKDDFKNFFDIWTRFFLRNMAFLATLHRYKEIEYIKNRLTSEINLSMFQINIQEQLNMILYNKDSLFREIYKEISSVDSKMVNEKCSQLIRKLK